MKLFVMLLALSLPVACGQFMRGGDGPHTSPDVYNDDGGQDPNVSDDGGSAEGGADAGEPFTAYAYEGHYDLSIGHVDVRIDQSNYLYGSYVVRCSSSGALTAAFTGSYPNFDSFFAGGCPVAVGSQSLTFYPSQATLTAFIRVAGIPTAPGGDALPVCRLGTWGAACNGH